MRTYLRELYVKIPKEYFLETETKFYWETYDRFEAYDLVELAGPKHIKSIPNLVYYYTGSTFKKCEAKEIDYNAFIAKTQTPLLHLKSLDSPAEITPNYVVPNNYVEAYTYLKREFEECKP